MRRRHRKGASTSARPLPPMAGWRPPAACLLGASPLMRRCVAAWLPAQREMLVAGKIPRACLRPSPAGADAAGGGRLGCARHPAGLPGQGECWALAGRALVRRPPGGGGPGLSQASHLAASTQPVSHQHRFARPPCCFPSPSSRSSPSPSVRPCPQLGPVAGWARRRRRASSATRLRWSCRRARLRSRPLFVGQALTLALSFACCSPELPGLLPHSRPVVAEALGRRQREQPRVGRAYESEWAVTVPPSRGRRPSSSDADLRPWAPTGWVRRFRGRLQLVRHHCGSSFSQAWRAGSPCVRSRVVERLFVQRGGEASGGQRDETAIWLFTLPDEPLSEKAHQLST